MQGQDCVPSINRTLLNSDSAGYGSIRPMAGFVELRPEELEQSIPAQFEKIACRYPQQIAVTYGRNALTYGFLNRRVNKVAQMLLNTRGAGKEPVAVLLEPGDSE